MHLFMTDIDNCLELESANRLIIEVYSPKSGIENGLWLQWMQQVCGGCDGCE